MFDTWKRERQIKRALRGLGRQRVAMILQPGNAWVIERSPPHSEQFDAALRTCHLRGWIEPIHDGIPIARLQPDGSFPGFPLRERAPIYRLTEGGWQVINRAQGWILAAFTVAILSLVVSILSLIISMKPGS